MNGRCSRSKSLCKQQIDKNVDTWTYPVFKIYSQPFLSGDVSNDDGKTVHGVSLGDFRLGSAPTSGGGGTITKLTTKLIGKIRTSLAVVDKMIHITKGNGLPEDNFWSIM